MKRVKIALVLVITLLFSGCWDRVEIDRRVFVSTIGVDVAKDIIKEKEFKNMEPNGNFAEENIKKLKVTYAFPDISDFSPSKGEIKGDNKFTAETYSMEGAMSQITSKSSRDIYLGHTMLLMFSKDLLQYPETVKEVIDYIERHPRLNRRMYVIMTDGAVENFVNIKTQIDKHIQSYISGLMDNSKRNSTILPVTLNEFLHLLSDNGNAILPSIKIDKEKNEFTLSGVAVIKNYEYKGSIGPEETTDLEILRGKLKSGVKVVYKNGHPYDYEIDGIQRKIKVEKSENKLKVNIELYLEGRLKGGYVEEKIFETGKLEELEQDLNKTISKECEKVIKHTQSDLKVEPIGLREYIEKFRPSLWREIKDQWESFYAGADIKVDVKTSIRRIGVSD